MTKRYGILRKKLEKLESDLHFLFTFPSDTETHEILSHGIEQQLEFLNHLLAAEIISSPSKPRHLYHIARRLSELETAFLHSQQQQQLDGNNMNDRDAASVCSCNESCLNDDGEAAVERDFDVSTVNYDVPEDSPVVDNIIKGVEEIDGDENESNINGRFFRILGCGMMMGAVCVGFVILRLCDSFLVIQPLGFLVPT